MGVDGGTVAGYFNQQQREPFFNEDMKDVIPAPKKIEHKETQLEE